MPFVLLMLLFAAPASAQPLLLGPAPASTPAAAVGSDVDLDALEAELQARLGVLQTQARWSLERAEARVRQLEADERSFVATRNWRARGEEAALWSDTLATYQELLRRAGQVPERWDSRVDQMLDAIAAVRSLRQQGQAELGGATWTAADAARAIEEERALLEALVVREAALAEERTGLEQAVAAGRDELEALRAELLRSQLAQGELVPAAEEGGEAQIVTDPLGPARQQGTRLKIRLGERALEAIRHDLEQAELRAQLAAAEDRMRRGRLEALDDLRESLASFEAGGLLARSEPLGSAANVEAGLQHALGLASAPQQGVSALRRALLGRPLRPALDPALLLGALLVIGLFLRRVDGRLARLEGGTASRRSAVAAARGVSRGLAPSLLVGAVVSLGLFGDGAFSAAVWVATAPILLAVVWRWTAFVRSDPSLGLSDDTVRVTTTVLRGSVALAAGISLLALLADLLGFPPATGQGLRFLLLAALALLGARLVLHPERLLQPIELALGLTLPPVVHRAAEGWRHAAALVPIALLVLWAAGYATLAGYLAQGLVWSLAVALLTPLLWRAARDGLSWVTGHPNGGGPLALSPAASTALHKGTMPLVLVGLAGVVVAAAAAAWGHGAPVRTLWTLLRHPLLDVGGSSISATSVVLFGVVLGGSLLAVRWMLRFLEASVYPLYDLDDGTRASLGTVVRYSGVALGVIAALDAAGVGVGVLTVFAGVIGIGVGFGSQTLAANFISGLILLLARPIAVGDTIEVGDLIGRVVRISSYATVLRTLDNTMVVVPNSKLVDESVINWSLEERKVRIGVAVGVAYGSDVERVKALLLEATTQVDGLLKRPAPVVRFDDFGDSSLLFRVLPWTTRVDDRMVLASALRYRIDALFREAGVEIAFPQLDVHLRGAEAVSGSAPGESVGPA